MTKLKKLFFFIVVIAFLFYLLPILLSPLIKNKIQKHLAGYLKTEIGIKNLRINPFARSIRLEDFYIENAKEFGRGRLLEVKETVFYLNILSLIKKRPAVSLILTEPLLHFYKLGKEKTNWDIFWSTEKPSQNGNLVLLKTLLVKDGIFRYTQENPSGHSASAELAGLSIFLKRHSIAPAHLENVPLRSSLVIKGFLPTEPKGRLAFQGKINLEREKPTFTGTINMDNISLVYFNCFYPEDSQIRVVHGRFCLTSQITCLDSKLTAKPDVAVRDIQLELTEDYATSDLFKLPIALVVDFFDLYKDELRFSFEVQGTLTAPEFQLGNIVAEKVSEIIGDSIKRTILTTPALLQKLGDKLKGVEEIIKKVGTTIGANIKEGASSAIKPIKEFISGVMEEKDN